MSGPGISICKSCTPQVPKGSSRGPAAVTKDAPGSKARFSHCPPLAESRGTSELSDMLRLSEPQPKNEKGTGVRKESTLMPSTSLILACAPFLLCTPFSTFLVCP